MRDPLLDSGIFGVVNLSSPFELEERHEVTNIPSGAMPPDERELLRQFMRQERERRAKLGE